MGTEIIHSTGYKEGPGGTFVEVKGSRTIAILMTVLTLLISLAVTWVVIFIGFGIYHENQQDGAVEDPQVIEEL